MDSESVINNQSEIGRLEGVILHRPGPEIERMNPENIQDALYSDILSLKCAQKEYTQFSQVLDKLTHTYQVKQLLEEALSVVGAKAFLLDRVCRLEHVQFLREYFESLTNRELVDCLIEGVEFNDVFRDQLNNLDKFTLRPLYQILQRNEFTSRFVLNPLYNLFYTRDIAMCIGNEVYISKMANNVRERECLLMKTIYKFNPMLTKNGTKNLAATDFDPGSSIEGGDVLVANDDVLLIGSGGRTNIKGISNMVHRIRNHKGKFHIILQELPLEPESFIHLDMVFTLLDKDCCMVYEPLILKENNYKTVHIDIDHDQIKYTEEKNIIEALKKVKIDLKPLKCGGGNDLWNQQREQWHSGANFFAVAPGQLMGYARNDYTLEELNTHGFDIIEAQQIISGKVVLTAQQKAVIAIEGSELSRGGGGCRCMTQPFKRDQVDW